mgnify:CR=1 FL=1
MSTTYAPSGVSIKVYPYEDFQGIDASRDIGALDTGQKQHLMDISNGFADWRGILVRDPGAVQRTDGNKVVTHVNFFGRDLAVWVQKDGGGLTLRSERDIKNPQQLILAEFNEDADDLIEIPSNGAQTFGNYVYFDVTWEETASEPKYPDFNWSTETVGEASYSLTVAFPRGYEPASYFETVVDPDTEESEEVVRVSADNTFNRITVTHGESELEDFEWFYEWFQQNTQDDNVAYIFVVRTDIQASDGAHIVKEVYPRNAVATSTIFNNKVVFASRDFPMYQYDGLKWEEIESGSDQRPAYIVSIQRRLAVAGQPGKRTIIDFSRVDKETIFTEDEDPTATQVTKAADIDVGNIIGTADEITGLGVFENSRLAVFTNDQTLVYQLSPNYTQWQIDDKANIKVGCISHNTITQAGADLLFCSRDGIHSLRRSETNGVTIYTIPMSNKIDLIYRDLVKQVDNLEEISAFYDQDEGQYHVFFPISDLITKRLTLSLSPVQGGESKWSSGDFLNARCGAKLGPNTLLGTPGGVWERKRIEDIVEFSPEMVVTTPILWQGAINDIKESYSFILQATGKGELQIEAFDERGRYLSAMQITIEDDAADDNFPDVPLSRQYERKFEHRYRGVQFRFTTRGKGLLKIIGFAVTVRTG